MSKHPFSKSACALALLLFCLAFGIPAAAQSTTQGAIGGSVKDPQGALVPNATVTVKNDETNKEVSATTDADGNFRVTQLQPGTYTVTVNASGFAAYNAKVVVEVGLVTPVDAALTVGGVGGDTVVVTSDAPVINTEQQDFSTNINQTSINNLPINGRRWSNFALLTPGAVPDGTFGLISFRGISGLLNNNTIDGGDNNQAFFAEERGRTRISYSISQSAIREFQVNTSSYSAEYGRSAGGVVNAVTKSGTNDFHGDIFYFQRNNKWGARNPLATNTVLVSAGPPAVFDVVGIKPEDVRHQFGGTIGGPIVKDKAFFFFSYDQQKRNFPGLARFSQPNFLNGATTSTLTARGLTPAQINDAVTFLGSITGTTPRRGDQKLFLPKVDWNITKNNAFSVTYNRLRWDSPNGIQTQATNTRAIDNFGDDLVAIDWVTLRLNSTLSNSLLNEARYQWGRDNEQQFSTPPAAGEPTNSIGGRSPQVVFGATSCGSASIFCFGIPEFLERAAFPNETRNQFADTMTYSSGTHTVKFGGDFNHVKDDINNIRFQGGEFQYTGTQPLNDFIIDYENFRTNGAIRALAGGTNGVCASSARRAGQCYGGSFNQGIGPLGLIMETQDINLFVQDDWKVHPRLSLNLGLRYEVQRNPDPISINPALPQTGNKVSDTNNWGPRIGFAYDMTGDGRTSLRGGWGMYYGRVINSTVYNALINTGLGPTQSQQQLSISATNLPTGCTAATCLPIYPNLLVPVGSTTTNVVVRPAVQYFANNFQLPLIHQTDLVLERQISRNTAVSISYLGSFGKYLPNFVDTNLPPPAGTVTYNVADGPFAGQVYRFPYFLGARPNPAFNQITEIRSDVFSKYHALVLQANRRLTDGLQFQMNYTLSRASDNGQSSVTFTSNNLPFNAFDQTAENSLSNFDRRHKFVASVVYNTDFASLKDNAAGRAIFNGWTFAPILNAFSGARYTGTINGNFTPASFGLSGSTPGGGVNGSGGSGRFAGAPRNFFKQPKIWYFDMRVSRRFHIKENMNFEVLAEGFNLFNRTQVTTVQTTLYNLSGTTLSLNPAFGSTTGADSTLFRERQIQLGARFQF
ncbi:MAG TPA: TonB-dependent receptor [Pyrinomonadaceae bacterium]|nr:TonB-dependent receptor [Pyrinomonadaceae bacterium]